MMRTHRAPRVSGPKDLVNGYVSGQYGYVAAPPMAPETDRIFYA